MANRLQVQANCQLCRPVLVCVDGWRGYPGVLQKVFRAAVPLRGLGRPHWRLWDGLQIAQVVKPCERGRVIGVLPRIVQGTAAQVALLLTATQGGGVINTWDYGSLLECVRVNVVSCAPAALGSTKATGTGLVRDKTTDSRVVFLTTIKWGATGKRESSRIITNLSEIYFVPRT